MDLVNAEVADEVRRCDGEVARESVVGEGLDQLHRGGYEPIGQWPDVAVDDLRHARRSGTCLRGGVEAGAQVVSPIAARFGPCDAFGESFGEDL